MNNQERVNKFESESSLVSIHCLKGEYFYEFADRELRGPFFDEIEAYQEAMRDVVKVLKLALDSLIQIEIYVAEIREPFQDLRRVTGT